MYDNEDRDTIEVTRYTTQKGVPYSYNFEPEGQPPKQKKKKGHRFVKVLALTLCFMMVAFGSGALGVYVGYNSVPVQPLPESQPVPASPVSQVNPEGKTLSLEDLFTGADPAVVAISTQTTGRNIFGQIVNMPASGSGFIISEDGYIATNNHVIENADTISVNLSDGTQYTATLVGNDSTTDLAVLKIDAKNLSYLTFGDSDSLKVGEMVAAIGNPLGELQNSFTVGYVSAKDREINIDGIPQVMLQTDTAVNSGNSGGPLLNRAGQVIGVVSAKSVGENVEGLGFAIPSNLASNVVTQLIDKGYVAGRASMGVSLSTRSNYNQTYIYVEVVDAAGAAGTAGVKVGDIILTANDTTVSSVSELKSILAGLSPGDALKLGIQRGNQKGTITLTLGEQTAKASVPEPLEEDDLFDGFDDFGDFTLPFAG